MALVVILAVSAAWWALALWPLPAEAPRWLLATREVCFGATSDGLPHAGGWVLLIGEPLGLLAILGIVWGRELRDGLTRLHQRLPGRLASGAVVLALALGLGAAAHRVSSARVAVGEPFDVNAPLPARGSADAPVLELVDQHGNPTALRDYRGQWVMLTFTFGHCDDICPVIVDHAKRARVDAGAAGLPLLVVTLDPWRDTPERLATLAQQWGLGPEDRFLSGEIAEVNRQLDLWRVPRVRDERTGAIGHGSTIIVVDPAGRVAWRIEGAPHRVREALRLVATESPAP
ncbi:MAG: SCO family protein [Gemmatimonadaceae bacterium]|nr:SCO family protein [Gemmatimonadaceae bacterium]